MMVQIKHKLAKQRGLAYLYRVYRRLGCAQLSPYENIYYCCTQRTASQWFKVIFRDPIVYKHTGLEVFDFGQYLNCLQETCSDGSTPKWEFGRLLYEGYAANISLPKRAICTHFYINYTSYLAIPKPEKYRTFFILRDPRDIVVSWYFSTRYSHKPIGNIPKYRNDLDKLSLTEGLKYSINKLEETGLFKGQRSWMHISADQENIGILRYEDFACDNYSFLKKLFAYLNIAMPEKELITLYDRHKFEKYSKNRIKGSEDVKSHYRKGMPGDWKSYFDCSIMAYFRQVTKNLLEELGYAE